MIAGAVFSITLENVLLNYLQEKKMLSPFVGFAIKQDVTAVGININFAALCRTDRSPAARGATLTAAACFLPQLHHPEAAAALRSLFSILNSS